MRLDAKRRFPTFASGRLRHFLKIGLPIQKRYWRSEGKQPLAKVAIGYNLLQVVDDVKFWLIGVTSRPV